MVDPVVELRPEACAILLSTAALLAPKIVVRKLEPASLAAAVAAPPAPAAAPSVCVP